MNKQRFGSLLERRGVLVLDGALATELESMGCDLSSPLWSAQMLVDAPERIAAVHRSYLEAGCDMIGSASYQASEAGFVRAGGSLDEGRELLRESIRLAVRERDAFALERELPVDESPLVAVSLGPYGAFLADGSEYRGNYKAVSADIERFHRQRLETVALEMRAGIGDVLACETVPSLDEGRIIADLLDELQLPGWISFSCRDGSTTCEGQELTDVARTLGEHEWLVGIGVNCTAPEHVPGLLERLRAGTHKPLLAYPNSGEMYDAKKRQWSGTSVLIDASQSAGLWRGAGASLIGGCCRTTPADMARIVAWRDQLSGGPL